MKKDLDKKIEALETAIETIQEALAELKSKAEGNRSRKRSATC